MREIGILVVVVLIFSNNPAWTYGGLSRPMTVCEVLERIDEYRDKSVMIRGVLAGLGGYHGTQIADERYGNKECPDLKARSLRWPAAIHLRWPGDPSDAAPAAAPAQIGELDSTFSALIRQLRMARNSGKYTKPIVVASVTGRLRSRNGLRLRYDEQTDRFEGDGYGQGGSFPAELIMENITDTAIVEDK